MSTSPISTIPECIALVRGLRGRVGEDWVRHQIEQISSDAAADTSGGRRQRKRFHPLGELFHQFEAEVEAGLSRSTPASVKLARIAHNVSLLSESHVQGLKVRISRLSSTNPELFAAVAFEVDIAALYVANGLSVEFLEDSRSGRRTAEFVVERGLEVECKHKRPYTARDRRNREQWELLARLLYRQGAPDNFGLYVEWHCKDDPNRQSIDRVLAEVRHLREGSAVVVATDTGEGFCYLSRLKSGVFGPGLKFDQPAGRPPLESFDYGHAEFTAEIVGGQGFTGKGKGYVLAFRSTTVPDWVKSCISSLKDATGQFSGNLPAVIYLEAPARKKPKTASGRGRLNTSIERFLKANSTVSAVVLATDHMSEGPDGTRCRRHFDLYANAEARFSIPTDLDVAKPAQFWSK